MKILITGGTGLVGSHIRKIVEGNKEKFEQYEFFFLRRSCRHPFF